MNSDHKHFLTPSETAHTIARNGRRVLHQGMGRTSVLSLLAGFYIAFGAQLSTVVTQDAAAFMGGSLFSIGLMLVVVCGAELFTGNSLLAGAALHGEITSLSAICCQLPWAILPAALSLWQAPTGMRMAKATHHVNRNSTWRALKPHNKYR